MSSPKLRSIARARCSQPSFVIPYGDTGRGTTSSGVG